MTQRAENGLNLPPLPLILARGPPQWIVFAHPPDETAQLRIHGELLKLGFKLAE
jgi:hypothetical protein